MQKKKRQKKERKKKKEKKKEEEEEKAGTFHEDFLDVAGIHIRIIIINKRRADSTDLHA